MDLSHDVWVHFNVLFISSSDKEGMNKKLLVIPTIVLSSALLLTGCTGGNDKPEAKNTSSSPASSSSASSPISSPAPTPIPVQGYVAPPEKMNPEYKSYYYSPMSIDEMQWSIYKSIGATSYKEDSSPRSTTVDEWVTIRDNKEADKFDKMYGEMASDVEQTALNVSEYLKKNPSANLDEIRNNKDLIVNRYDKVGSIGIEQDSSTEFYFSKFSIKDNKGLGYGILVPQEGKTPDFNK